MIEPRSHQGLPPLLQLNISLNGGNSLTCQQCRPPASVVEYPGPAAVKTNGHGAHGIGPARAAGGLDVRLARQALSEAAALGLQTVRLLSSGAAAGDTDALDALLDLLPEYPASVVFETSGGGITPARAARMARSPRFSACVGLNGADAATHEAVEGAAMYGGAMPNSFDAACCAAQMLGEQGVPVEIVFSVQRRNAVQIIQMVRLAERLGAQSLRFVFACPVAGGGMGTAIPGGAIPGGINGAMKNGGARRPTMEAAPLAVEEMIAIGRRVERELARGTRLRLLFDQPPAFRGLYPWARGEEQGRCGILNTLGIVPGVGASGVFALCGTGAGHARSAPALVLGSLGEDSLERIWREHPTLAMLREGLPGRLRGVCERCTVKHACMGYCPTENYLRAGSFWSPYWFCEAADGVQLFPASRLVEV